MKILKAVHTLTKGLYDHLQKPMPKDEDDRDAYIETMNDMLEKREQLIPHVSRPQNEDEEKLGQDIVAMNKVVNQKIAAAQGLIRMDITKLQQRKETGKKYESPYEGPTADGVFFDSKK
ncbi:MULTISPECIES: flagellar protein [Bacillaceae]|uniref:Flagellar protein FliT n=1 Tax=Evansella alkalicola TaxID=745819 RepID=A0ABS6JUL6_9BACI|nr:MULTISPECIES: flagellar protein [Bacillaceae]MBU9722276.1 flagellar protein [Bacillus alkalicola]